MVDHVLLHVRTRHGNVGGSAFSSVITGLRWYMHGHYNEVYIKETQLLTESIDLELLLWRYTLSSVVVVLVGNLPQPQRRIHDDVVNNNSRHKKNWGLGYRRIRILTNHVL